MDRKLCKVNFSLLQLLLLVFVTASFLSCNQMPLEGMLVVTQVPKDAQTAQITSDEDLPYFDESRIVSINPKNPDNAIKVLTKDFYSACSPEVSYDATKMIFSGQLKKDSKWQIWEMDLKSLEYTQITSSKNHCIDAAYLPGDRVVYSKMVKNPRGESVFSLFVIDLNDSKSHQITYNPNRYLRTSTLKDGRILSISKEVYPHTKASLLMISRPDGTKEELFYQSPEAKKVVSNQWEANNGNVYFIEKKDSDDKGGELVSVSYNNPLNSRAEYSNHLEGSFKSIDPQNNGNLWVSYRTQNENTFGLYEFNIKEKSIGKSVFTDSDFDIIDIDIVEVVQRPRKIPSEVKPDVETALLVCQDINFTGYSKIDNELVDSKAVKVEILGVDQSMGIIDAEKDGSIYLKVVANTPFKIQTLDKNDEIVGTPSSWIFLRPNERRGCVGCHQGNNLVPENRQPLAVQKEPIEIPYSGTILANHNNNLK